MKRRKSFLVWIKSFWVKKKPVKSMMIILPLEIGKPKPTYDWERRRSCHSCYFDLQSVFGCMLHSDKPNECPWYTIGHSPPKEVLEGFVSEVIERKIINRCW